MQTKHLLPTTKILKYTMFDGGHGGDQDYFSGKLDDKEKFWGKGQTVGHEVNSPFMKVLYLCPLMDKACIFFSRTLFYWRLIFLCLTEIRITWGKPSI